MTTQRIVPRIRLGDILRVKHGFAFKGEYFSNEIGAVILTPGNFDAGGGLKFQTGKDRSYTGDFPPEFELNAGDLLVVMTDLTQEARILGAPAFVPNGVVCLHNQRLGKIYDLDEGRLDKRFLYHIMNSADFREQLKSTATGSTVRHTSPGRIYEYHAPVFPLSEQRRIASILGAYDDLIEVNRRRIAVLEAMARGVFEEWFVRFRLPHGAGHDLAPDEALPDGWSVGSIADIASILGHSVSPAAKPDVLFAHFSLPAFDASHRPVIEAGSAIMSNKLKFESPAVLVSKLNPRIARVWHVIQSEQEPQIASTEFVPLVAKDGVSSALLYFYVSSSAFRERLSRMSGGTSTSHQRVKPADILKTPICIPPKQMITQANETLSPIAELVDGLTSANHALGRSRDLLLPRLISGDLSVATAERALEAAA